MGSVFYSLEDRKCIDEKDLSLDSCLACSGCATNEEMEFLKAKRDLCLDSKTMKIYIISSESKLSIYSLYPEYTYDEFEASFSYFLKKKYNALYVIDTSYFIKEKSNGISAECPAIVLYCRRKFPEKLKHLDFVKTYHQLAIEYAAELIEKENRDVEIVSISQCYDKKFELSEIKPFVKYYMGTKDFYGIIKEEFKVEKNLEYICKDWERSYEKDDVEKDGLEKSINVLKSNKTDLNKIEELRICKGGCIMGPAQIEKNIYLGGVKFLDGSRRIKRDCTGRILYKPKRHTFSVEW